MKRFRIYHVVAGGLYKHRSNKIARFDHDTFAEAEQACLAIIKNRFALNQLAIQDYGEYGSIAAIFNKKGEMTAIY